MRWKALDEIYKIYMLLHRSDLNISENFRQTFSHFSAIFAKFTHFRKMLFEFCLEFDEILSEFRKYFRTCWKILNFLNFLAKCTDRILTELWCEKFEWFDPSPIEPFNSGPGRRARGPVARHGHEPRPLHRGGRRRLVGAGRAAAAPGGDRGDRGARRLHGRRLRLV